MSTNPQNPSGTKKSMKAFLYGFLAALVAVAAASAYHYYSDGPLREELDKTKAGLQRVSESSGANARTLQHHGEKINATDKQVDDHSTRLKQLETEFSDLAQRVEKTEAEIASTEEKLETLRKAASANQERIERTEKELAALRQENATRRLEMDKLRAQQQQVNDDVERRLRMLENGSSGGLNTNTGP